ncbi:glycosyltransferase family 4 protein [Oscillatoriales cyanobacterium LEGE 11467]|uniref:Glycosyltransferase family 4 protein n=1 Tax=Zarconia navalis LEGE 11467 TaxID=1828826 RepID=A0A928Z8H4_9CYAN|nr:glycosyltransferase family 4 protein [Zarconia navalis]MBE9039851.1 glycosyltransferase family 4 protein [Zarconia navalis LEGE 11467]
MSKRFIAVQTGARYNYAIPSILEKSGMLDAFYTDLCASSGMGAVLDRWIPKSIATGSIRRLLNRRVPSNIEDKVHTFDRVSLHYWVRNILAKENKIQKNRALSQFNQEFGRSMIRKGTGRATHLFSMFGEGTDFLEFAKQKNIKIITDIFISPLTYQIIQEEKKKFRDLESMIPSEIIRSSYAWFDRVCDLTDTFLVPSEFVGRGLEQFGVKPHQYYKVPYGVDKSWLKLVNAPLKGRILFVGTAELRKGIHILGMAAQKLSHRCYEFRVVGGVSDKIRSHPLTQNLNFRDRIPRSEIQQEYVRSDIFVLPTLAEGSAQVTYEALAAGIPVITTPAAGSVVRDGIEGFIVPERDPVAIAERIEMLVEDRELRDRIAVAAKERAKEYTWDKYADRLLSIFQSV